MDKDEFDDKAEKFLDKGNQQRVRDILREYAMCIAFEEDKELDKPTHMIDSLVDISTVNDFTEYRVAKSLIRNEIKRGNIQ
jgi:hypothetical protein